MAERPVFAYKNGKVRVYRTEFEWFPGFAKSQQQKCIRSLHENARLRHGFASILEISSKSEDELGATLSAFNLKLDGVSVECIYQSSKKFANGGPYRDILQMTSKEAKRDLRLKNSGVLIFFEYDGRSWGLKPTTAFYDYIYVKALTENGHLEKVRGYEAFTDIVFNPQNSMNCQARACAVSRSEAIIEAVVAGDIDKYLLLYKNIIQV